LFTVIVVVVFVVVVALVIVVQIPTRLPARNASDHRLVVVLKNEVDIILVLAVTDRACDDSVVGLVKLRT
jgi:hypothetical protein